MWCKKNRCITANAFLPPERIDPKRPVDSTKKSADSLRFSQIDLAPAKKSKTN